MGWFDKKPAAIPFDAAQHEQIAVNGQDDNGPTHHEYIRDTTTQRIIGTPTDDGQVQPLDTHKRGWWQR